MVRKILEMNWRNAASQIRFRIVAEDINNQAQKSIYTQNSKRSVKLKAESLNLLQQT